MSSLSSRKNAINRRKARNLTKKLRKTQNLHESPCKPAPNCANGLPICSHIIYLRPDAGRKDLGNYISDVPSYGMRIEYRVIRLGEQDSESVLEARPPGLKEAVKQLASRTIRAPPATPPPRRVEPLTPSQHRAATARIPHPNLSHRSPADDTPQAPASHADSRR